MSAPDSALASASAATVAVRPSAKRRREDLFLDDTEHFAFDFGGEAVDPATTTVSGAADKKKDDPDALDEAAVAAVAAVDMRRPLTLEEVTQYAAASYRLCPGKFLTILKPRKGGKSQATLDEAIGMFQEGLRRYDAGLWKADKERKRVEKENEKKRRKRA